MAYDYTAHAKRIEHALTLAGCHGIAARLEDARLGGSTSGEILMGLRHECRIAIADLVVSPEIKEDLRALVAQIDATGV